MSANDHKPITEAELKALESWVGADPWWSDGRSVLAGAHEADVGEVAHAADNINAKMIAQMPRLISEVRRLREALGHVRKVVDVASTDYDSAQGARIEHIDSIAEEALGEGRCEVNPACDAAGGHSRCFKDGRWLDDGSEM